MLRQPQKMILNLNHYVVEKEKYVTLFVIFSQGAV